MRRKKTIYSLIIALFVIFSLFILLFIKGGLVKKFSQNLLIARVLGLPIPVYVVPVVKGDSTRFIGANGISEASLIVRVSFPSLEAGSKLRVAEVLVKVSDHVKKGQVLADLEYVPLEEDVKRLRENLPLINSKLKTAKENLKEKRNYFFIIKDLFSKGFATRIELESARDSFVAAETVVKSYEQQMIDTTSFLKGTSSSFRELNILSPVEGVILEKKVEEGDISSVGTPMFSVGVLSPLYLVANVSQEDKDGIYLEQNGEVSFNFLPGRTFRGQIVRIDPTVEVETQTFKVWLSLRNENMEFLPGSAAFVRFNAKVKSLVIPRLAVIGMPDEPSVFVVGDDNNKAYLKRVVLGMAFPPNKLEIIKGLSEGEKVVTFNLKYLDDGSSVSIINNKVSQ